MSDWQRLREIVRIHSDWVTLIAERWLCDQGKELEDWRVEKVDSVIVLPIHRQLSLTALMEPPMIGLMEPLRGGSQGSRTGAIVRQF